jgi:Transcriptional accessory protein
MNEKHLKKIAEELKLKTEQVKATADLLSGGATLPFIARYRKEATGSLNEIAIATIRDRWAQLQELDKRRESILKSLEERELLTDTLKEKIAEAETLSVLEDLYLPYRPKRRTRATVARERGLEPLADRLFKQEDHADPLEEAAAFVDPEKGVDTLEDALSGARDIVAEWVNEDREARSKVRVLYEEKGLLRAKVVPGKEAEGGKYRDYFDWEEPLGTIPSHRVLAVFRGEKEGFLTLRLSPSEEAAVALLEDLFVKGDSPASEQ